MFVRLLAAPHAAMEVAGEAFHAVFVGLAGGPEIAAVVLFARGEAQSEDEQ